MTSRRHRDVNDTMSRTTDVDRAQGTAEYESGDEIQSSGLTFEHEGETFPVSNTPPRGFGHDGDFNSLHPAQKAQLQEQWDKLEDKHKIRHARNSHRKWNQHLKTNVAYIPPANATNVATEFEDEDE